jgi:hypothetical protein
MILVLFLLAAPAATPVPSPPPAARPTPVTAADPSKPRTLADIARERKGREKGSGGTFSVAGASTPEGAAAGSGGASGADAESPILRVEDVRRGGVRGSGRVDVTGQVRNTGATAACSVSLTIRLHDERGRLLVTGTAYPSPSRLAAGATATFEGSVHVPPLVLNPENRVSADKGEVRYLGRAEAEVASSRACK